MIIESPTIYGTLSVINNMTVTGTGTFATLSSNRYTGSPHFFGVSLDGGTSAVATGAKGFAVIPLSGTITGWSIAADGVSPTATFDVWKVPTGTQTPVLSNTIMGVKPALATGNIINSTNLSAWDTTLRQYDVVGFYLDACAVATKLNLTIYYNSI